MAILTLIINPNRLQLGATTLCHCHLHKRQSLTLQCAQTFNLWMRQFHTAQRRIRLSILFLNKLTIAIPPLSMRQPSQIVIGEQIGDHPKGSFTNQFHYVTQVASVLRWGQPSFLHVQRRFMFIMFCVQRFSMFLLFLATLV